MSRLLDILIAVAGLILTSPLLLAAALATRLESSGPVIYRHRRVGRDGRQFDLWKLRTMVQGAERMGAGLYIEPGDARITRTGRLLRRFSLDELPNLVNVLRGEMAIVGPRPTVQEQVDRYTAHQRRRLEVKPGITGWAQVNGRLTALVAGADRAGRLVRGQPLARPGPAHPRPDRPHAGHRPRPVQRRAAPGLGLGRACAAAPAAALSTIRRDAPRAVARSRSATT